MVAADAPGAMIVDGKILCALSNTFNSTTSYFYEYDYLANSYKQVSGPTKTFYNLGTFQFYMLDLPDGTILCSVSTTDLYVYRPSGSPLAARKPTISSVRANADGSFHLIGTLLNGISAGAAYGDDAQMD